MEAIPEWVKESEQHGHEGFENKVVNRREACGGKGGRNTGIAFEGSKCLQRPIVCSRDVTPLFPGISSALSKSLARGHGAHGGGSFLENGEGCSKAATVSYALSYLQQMW